MTLLIIIIFLQIIPFGDEPIQVFQFSNEVPTGFNITDPLPNAFSPVTSYKLEIPENALIKVNIYRDNEYVTYFKKLLSAGIYTVNWNLNDSHGERVLSGAYDVKIQIISQVRETQLLHSHTLILVL